MKRGLLAAPLALMLALSPRASAAEGDDPRPAATTTAAARAAAPSTGTGPSGAPRPTRLRQARLRPTQHKPHPAEGPGAGDAHGDDEGGAANPHGHGGHGGGNDMFQAPEDGAMDDPTLPVGSLEIHIVDPAGKCAPEHERHARCTLQLRREGREPQAPLGDDERRRRRALDELETGSTVAYRPMVITDGATFSVMPFRMPEKTGMRAILHVYPVVESIESALIVTQSVIYTEVKDDRIQVQQAFKVYNFGKSAWVPKDLVIPLPDTFTAFTTQQGMSDVGVEPSRQGRPHPRDVRSRAAHDRVPVAAPVRGRGRGPLRRRDDAAHGSVPGDRSRLEGHDARRAGLSAAAVDERRHGPARAHHREAAPEGRPDAVDRLRRHPRPSDRGPREDHRDAPGRRRPRRSASCWAPRSRRAATARPSGTASSPSSRASRGPASEAPWPKDLRGLVARSSTP